MTPHLPSGSTTTGFSRRSLLKVLVTAGGVVAMPSMLAACTNDTSEGGSPTPKATALDKLQVGLPSSISTLDVSREAGIMNFVVALLTQESLLGIDANGKLVPSLAESWDAPDPTTYVFTLRKGVTFTDGTPLTVEDVIASIDVHAAKGSTSALAYAYAGVTSVRKTGPDELTIKLSAPNSAFAWVLSPGTLQVTSKAFLDKNGDKIGTPGVLLLGTGPYQVTEFAPDSHVTFERNASWWGGKVEIGTVRLDFITDESTRKLALRQGSIDVALQVPLRQVKEWSALDGVDILTATDNSLVTLAFNTSVAPWNDRNVREAVARAIDRKGIVDSILGGHAEVALTIPTKDQWGGLLTKEQADELYGQIPQYDFDLDAAKKLIAQSSVPNGFSAQVTYPNSGPEIGRALLTLAENLKSLGIKLEVKEITLEQWIADLGNHAGISMGWYFPTTGDPAEYVLLLLNKQYAAKGGTNLAEYRNDKVSSLLDQEVTSTDPAKRAQLLGDALVAAAADVPYQPLWWGQAATAFGGGTTADGYGPYFFLGPWPTRVHAR